MKINNDINGRSAANLVYAFSEISTPIYFIKNDRMANAKSITGILSLDIKKNDIINLSYDGNIYEIDSIIKDVLG